MRQLGFGFLVGAVVCEVVCLAGYMASSSKGMFGGEPVAWLTLSREERAEQQRKTKALLRSWWPKFRNVGFLGGVLAVLGALFAILGG